MKIPKQFETINKELKEEANNIKDEFKVLNENKRNLKKKKN